MGFGCELGQQSICFVMNAKQGLRVKSEIGLKYMYYGQTKM
jgi:hypothetical protein